MHVRPKLLFEAKYGEPEELVPSRHDFVDPVVGQRSILADHVARRLDDSRIAAHGGDWATAWTELEDAHVLSQPLAWPHIRVHAAMWSLAWRTRQPGELWGQSLRLILAGTGSLSGRYPKRNSGRAGISAWSAMPIRPDLAQLLDQVTVSSIS